MDEAGCIVLTKASASPLFIFTISNFSQFFMFFVIVILYLFCCFCLGFFFLGGGFVVGGVF